VHAELLTNLAEVDGYRAAWDALAVAASRPFCAPSWMLAWFEHVTSDASELRLVLVFDDDDLVGVAPYYLTLGPGGLPVHRFLCCGVSTRIGPLAAPGYEERVAALIGSTLAGSEPRPRMVTFDGIEADSPWPAAMASGWPGRAGAWVHTDNALPAFIVDRGEGTFDDWLAGRPRKFAKEVRRLRRRLAERGGRLRLSSPESLDADLGELMRLHYARWEDRGGSGNLDPAVEVMLRQASRELIAGERARLWVLELEDRVISAELMIAAGDELGSWGGGFDERCSNLAPGVLTLLAAIEDSFARGERRFYLGEGLESYKERLADPVEEVTWRTLFPRDSRYVATRARMLPPHFEYWARRRARPLDPQVRRRIRRVLTLGRG
jgi:CelD/BcsL family acetyltransferase involved in cellulose biosynthesis